MRHFAAAFGRFASRLRRRWKRFDDSHRNGHCDRDDHFDNTPDGHFDASSRCHRNGHAPRNGYTTSNSYTPSHFHSSPNANPCARFAPGDGKRVVYIDFSWGAARYIQAWTRQFFARRVSFCRKFK